MLFLNWATYYLYYFLMLVAIVPWLKLKNYDLIISKHISALNTRICQFFLQFSIKRWNHILY